MMNSLSSLLFFSTIASTTLASGVTVISDIVHNETSNESYQMEMQAPYRTLGRQNGKAILLPSFVKKIQHTAGLLPGTEMKSAMVQTTVLTQSSPRHVDHYTADSDEHERLPVHGRVGFVLLNSNENAYFDHGDTSIPIVSGSFVHFKANVPHNTVVKSGNVKMLGPFDLRTFRSVGEPNDAVETTYPTVSLWPTISWYPTISVFPTVTKSPKIPPSSSVSPTRSSTSTANKPLTQPGLSSASPSSFPTAATNFNTKEKRNKREKRIKRAKKYKRVKSKIASKSQQGENDVTGSQRIGVNEIAQKHQRSGKRPKKHHRGGNNQTGNQRAGNNVGGNQQIENNEKGGINQRAGNNAGENQQVENNEKEGINQRAGNNVGENQQGNQRGNNNRRHGKNKRGGNKKHGVNQRAGNNAGENQQVENNEKEGINQRAGNNVGGNQRGENNRRHGKNKRGGNKKHGVNQLNAENQSGTSDEDGNKNQDEKDIEGDENTEQSNSDPTTYNRRSFTRHREKRNKRFKNQN